LLQSHGESLTNDELRELAEQHIQSEFTASNAQEATPVREISTEFLSISITAITQIMDQFTDNLDYKQSSKVRQGVLETISCYQELLCERKLKKRQSALDSHIMKKPRFTEDPQTGPSSGV
jgi:hypothetical protein